MRYCHFGVSPENYSDSDSDSEYQSLPSRSGIRDACHNMDMCMETVMDVLSSLTTFHLQNKEIQKGIVVVSEIEKIETDF